MPSDRFEIEPEESPERSSGCLKGCLIASVVVLLLVMIAGIWIARNWRDWITNVSTEAIERGMEKSGLPEQEQREVMDELNRIFRAFQEKRVSEKQLERFLSELARSPLMTSFFVSAVRTRYLDDSGLSEEERREGERNLGRFVKGVLEGKIQQEAIDRAFATVADKQPDGDWQLREQVSDEQLKKLFSIARVEADGAEIPEEVEEVDPSDEIGRIVDEALQEQNVK